MKTIINRHKFDLLRYFSLLLAVLSFSLLFSGCEDNPTEIEDYDPQPKLTAFIYNGAPVEEVILERVGSLYSYYDPLDYMISGADIILFPVDNPAAGDTLHFIDSTATRGAYVPAQGESLVPQGNVRYRIEARKPSEELYLWSEIVVPDTFTLTVNDTFILTRDSNPDTIYGTFDWNDPIMSWEWSRSDSAGGYIFNALCLTPADLLVPLNPEIDPEDIDEEPGRYSMELLVDYVFSGEVPWIAFWWVGPHRIVFNACNRDYFDYAFSLFRQQQQGLMEEPVYNVNGGLGIFGGFCKISFMLFMERVQ